MKKADTTKRKKPPMKVAVMSAELAGSYRPVDRTVVIRIFDSSKRSQKTYPRLKKGLYVDIFEYVFDDIPVERIYPDELDKIVRDDRLILFDESIAERILDDIVSIKDDFETILVHCNIGMSRSPAVAAAVMDLVERINYALIPTPDHIQWLDEKMGVSSFLSRSKMKGFKKTTSKGLKNIYPYNLHVYETLVKVGKKKYG
jgi:hypothetical protein